MGEAGSHREGVSSKPTFIFEKKPILLDSMRVLKNLRLSCIVGS